VSCEFSQAVGLGYSYREGPHIFPNRALLRLNPALAVIKMWYKNIAGRFFGLVTKHACDRRTDRQTDRITTPKTVLA